VARQGLAAASGCFLRPWISFDCDGSEVAGRWRAGICTVLNSLGSERKSNSLVTKELGLSQTALDQARTVIREFGADGNPLRRSRRAESLKGREACHLDLTFFGDPD
jgi:hypothetical protein